MNRTRVIARQPACWGFVLLSTGLCSCAAVTMSPAIDPFQQASQATAGRAVVREQSRQFAGTVDNESNSPAEAGFVRTVGHTQERSGTAYAVAASAEDQPATTLPGTFSQAEPRMPLQSDLQFAEDYSGALLERTSPANHRDEYLIDGGDRGLPVHYSPYNRQGLETEDTVVEYVDHSGKHHVKATNEVAIYAPRFGAVRTISNPHGGMQIQRLAGTSELSHGVGIGSRVVAINYAKNERAGGIRVRSRASGVGADVRRDEVDQSASVVANEKLLNAYEDFAILRSSQFKQADEAWIAAGIDAALVWTRNLSPVISAQTESLMEVKAEFLSAEIVGREEKAGTKGRLRIVKLADKKVAAVGDVITFTIRYENLGDRELHHIRIVDNLTPRLEYVDDSDTSDRAGKLVLEDNDEGSLILIFELDDPLPGRSGGVVTFQARVR